MIEIKPPTLPATRLDPAPRATPRAEPEAIAAEKLREPAQPGVERRSNPDRRRRNVAVPFERRLGASRRRRTVDITI